MGFFNNSSDDNKYSEEKVESAAKSGNRTNPFDISINDLNREITSQINNVFNSSGFQSVWQDFKPSDRWEQWGNFKRGRGAVGLKAYPTPTLTDYSNCVKNEGSSVWDENGWWRCLFPRAKITKSGELSKEDVEADSTNKYGLFFNSYNDLMDWRVKVRDLVKQKEENERKIAQEAKESANIQSIYDDYAKDVDFIDNNNDNGNEVVSTSKSVFFKTLDNGDAEEITKLRKIYKDGTVHNQHFKKLIPKDGTLPIVEQLPSDNKDSGKLTGWIWDDK